MPGSDRKFAFLIKTTTDETSQTLTSLQQAFELADAGYEVKIYLDGAATEWPSYLEENPDNVLAPYFNESLNIDLFAGACGLCAVNFEAIDGLQTHGIPILGEGSDHSIDMAELVAEGFELVVVS